MAWQKGPGEGYHAAKDDALAINPRLICRAQHWVRGGRHGVCGYIVEDGRGGKTIGSGKLSRDAWGDAFLKLGGRYEFGRAILPPKRKLQNEQSTNRDEK